MTDLTKYLTVREAAQGLGLTEERVRELINLKQIKGILVAFVFHWLRGIDCPEMDTEKAKGQSDL